MPQGNYPWILTHVKKTPGNVHHLFSRRFLGTWSFIYAKRVGDILQQHEVEVKLSEKASTPIQCRKFLKGKICFRRLTSCIYSSRKQEWPKGSSLMTPNHHETVLYCQSLLTAVEDLSCSVEFLYEFCILCMWICLTAQKNMSQMEIPICILLLWFCENGFIHSTKLFLMTMQCWRQFAPMWKGW